MSTPIQFGLIDYILQTRNIPTLFAKKKFRDKSQHQIEENSSTTVQSMTNSIVSYNPGSKIYKDIKDFFSQIFTAGFLQPF